MSMDEDTIFNKFKKYRGFEPNSIFVRDLEIKYNTTVRSKLNPCLFLMFSVEVMNKLRIVEILQYCDEIFIRSLGRNTGNGDEDSQRVLAGYPRKVKILDRESFLDIVGGYVIPRTPLGTIRNQSDEHKTNIDYFFYRLGWGIYRPDLYDTVKDYNTWKTFMEKNNDIVHGRWEEYLQSLPFPIFQTFISNGSIIEYLGIKRRWSNPNFNDEGRVSGIESFNMISPFYKGYLTFPDSVEDIINLPPPTDDIHSVGSDREIVHLLASSPSPRAHIAALTAEPAPYFTMAEWEEASDRWRLEKAEFQIESIDHHRRYVFDMMRTYEGLIKKYFHRKYPHTDFGLSQRNHLSHEEWSQKEEGGTLKSILNNFMKYFPEEDKMESKKVQCRGTYDHFRKTWLGEKLTIQKIWGLHHVVNSLILTSGYRALYPNKKAMVDLLVRFLKQMGVFACMELRLYTIYVLEEFCRHIQENILPHAADDEDDTNYLNIVTLVLTEVMNLAKGSWKLMMLTTHPNGGDGKPNISRRRVNYFVDFDPSDLSQAGHHEDEDLDAKLEKQRYKVDRSLEYDLVNQKALILKLFAMKENRKSMKNDEYIRRFSLRSKAFYRKRLSNLDAWLSDAVGTATPPVHLQNTTREDNREDDNDDDDEDEDEEEEDEDDEEEEEHDDDEEEEHDDDVEEEENVDYDDDDDNDDDDGTVSAAGDEENFEEDQSKHDDQNTDALVRNENSMQDEVGNSSILSSSLRPIRDHGDRKERAIFDAIKAQDEFFSQSIKKNYDSLEDIHSNIKFLCTHLDRIWSIIKINPIPRQSMHMVKIFVHKGKTEREKSKFVLIPLYFLVTSIALQKKAVNLIYQHITYTDQSRTNFIRDATKINDHWVPWVIKHGWSRVFKLWNEYGLPTLIPVSSTQKQYHGFPSNDTEPIPSYLYEDLPASMRPGAVEPISQKYDGLVDSDDQREDEEEVHDGRKRIIDHAIAIQRKYFRENVKRDITYTNYVKLCNNLDKEWKIDKIEGKTDSGYRSAVILILDPNKIEKVNISLAFLAAGIEIQRKGMECIVEFFQRRDKNKYLQKAIDTSDCWLLWIMNHAERVLNNWEIYNLPTLIPIEESILHDPITKYHGFPDDSSSQNLYYFSPDIMRLKSIDDAITNTCPVPWTGKQRFVQSRSHTRLSAGKEKKRKREENDTGDANAVRSRGNVPIEKANDDDDDDDDVSGHEGDDV